MKTTRLAAITAAFSFLAACGGGGGSPAPAPTPNPPAQSFDFTTPALGDTEIWQRVYTDDAANVIDQTQRMRVSATSADGSFTEAWDDPTNNSVTVDGILFRIDPELDYLTSADSLTDYVQTAPDGTQRTCDYSYGTSATTTADGRVHALAAGTRRPSSLTVGQTWSGSYTITCTGATPVVYTQTGTVLDAEPVTVAAGTFNAVKESETLSWTTAEGQNVTESVTLWRDIAHSLFVLKTDVAFTRSGTVPAHYVTHETRELQSRAP